MDPYPGESPLFRAPSLTGIDLTALFNASVNAYLILDRDLRIVGANDAYLLATRSSREGIVGRELFDAFPSNPYSTGGRMLRESIGRVLRDGKSDHLALIPYPVPDEMGDSRLRYWSASHTPVLDDSGQVEYILQHTADVTELIRQRDGVRTSIIDQHGVLRRAQAVQASNQALAEERQQLRRLFEDAPGFTALLRGPDHVFELVNAAFTKLVGRDVIARPIAEALPEIQGQSVLDILEAVRSTAKPFVGRAIGLVLRPDPNGEVSERVVDLVFQPILDASDGVDGIFIQGNDITEQKVAERRLARQTELLRLAQEAGGIGTFDYDIPEKRIWGSRTFADLFGLEPSDEGWPIADVVANVVPEDRDKVMTSTERPLSELVTRTEYRVQVRGALRWLARQGEIRHDALGQPIQVLGAVYDITERKQAEAEMQLLMQESAHRVKNMIAMVQAIVTQTLRSASDVASAQVTVSARLAALAHAHDTLMKGTRASADIRTVVETSTRLLSDGEERFRIVGDGVMLGPDAVLGLALMLHELGTNALKHGALSVPEGRVEIGWSVRTDEQAQAIVFGWRELGGPEVTAPARKGFGSRLMERGLASYLGGEVNLIYDPAGLVCHASIRSS